MAYVDGFIIAVNKDKLDDYKRMADMGRDFWMENGALSYGEAVGDEINQLGAPKTRRARLSFAV